MQNKNSFNRFKAQEYVDKYNYYAATEYSGLVEAIVGWLFVIAVTIGIALTLPIWGIPALILYLRCAFYKNRLDKYNGLALGQYRALNGLFADSPLSKRFIQARWPNVCEWENAK